MIQRNTLPVLPLQHARIPPDNLCRRKDRSNALNIPRCRISLVETDNNCRRETRRRLFYPYIINNRRGKLPFSRGTNDSRELRALADVSRLSDHAFSNMLAIIIINIIIVIIISFIFLLNLISCRESTTYSDKPSCTVCQLCQTRREVFLSFFFFFLDELGARLTPLIGTLCYSIGWVCVCVWVCGRRSGVRGGDVDWGRDQERH